MCLNNAVVGRCRRLKTVLGLVINLPVTFAAELAFLLLADWLTQSSQPLPRTCYSRRLSATQFVCAVHKKVGFRGR